MIKISYGSFMVHKLHLFIKPDNYLVFLLRSNCTCIQGQKWKAKNPNINRLKYTNIRSITFVQ